MAVQNLNPEMEQQARLLASDNRATEPDITRVFWFPDEKEVRLVELTQQVPAGAEGRVIPFYFRPSLRHKLPAPSAIAMIRSEELGKLALPQGWGDWNDAVEL